MNYKDIPYDTKWLDFPDIAPTLRDQYNVKPYQAVALGASVGAEYTLPAVRMPRGEVIMDSARIAREIEETFPSPALPSDPDLNAEAEAVLRGVAQPLYAELTIPIRDNILTDHGRPHWIEAREKAFGMTLDDFHATYGGPQAWEAAKGGLDGLRQFVRVHKKDEGPFVLGSQVSYVDLLLLAFLAAARKVDVDGIFRFIVGDDAALNALWDASQKWSERDR